MTSQTTRRISINSGGNTLQRKADINLTLDGGNDRVYSTYDIITGRVTVQHENDVILTELVLALEGASATQVGNTSDNGPASGTAKGRHHFLKLQHPLDPSLLSGSVIEDGRTSIEIPFGFFVPERILPGACSHKTNHTDVKDAHLLLPPTLEDDHYARGVQLARISYGIRVLASLQILTTGTRQNESRSIGVRIAPAREEQPPVGLYDDQNDYCLQRTMPVRSRLRKVLGELTVETSQPPCLPLSTQPAQGDTISTTVKLTYIPANQTEQPPDITAIATKLLEYTFYGASPFEEIPRLTTAYEKMTLQKSYLESFQLSTRKLNNVSWTEQKGSLSESSDPPATGSGAVDDGSIYYATSMLVPLAIPQVQNSKGLKKFPPSFHSCLVSRTHAVEFEIHVKGNSSIILRTPIQLVARTDRRPPTSPTLPIATLMEIDRVFSLEPQGNAPGYEEIPSEQGHGMRRPSQADQLPDYAPDTHLTNGQTQRAAAHRHSVSTSYEVPEQEWQNLWTGAKWAYGKAKAFQQRRSSKG